MIPMVFCASLPPWPRLNAAAERSWSRRNRCSTLRGVDPLNSHISPSISTNAKNIPSSGDTTMKITVFSKLGAFTTLQPALAMPAPTTPPISACDDEVGRPSHQVVRFQAMAPTRPPNTTASLTTFGSMIVPTVLATWVRKTAKAMKLKNAAQTTAAIELAASWKPLEKSKTAARHTSAMTETRVTSSILQHDALDRVRDVLQLVQGLLDLVDDVLPHQQVARGVLGVEAVEVRSGVPVEPVALVLELVDPDPVGAQRLLFQVAQVLQAGGGLVGG